MIGYQWSVVSVIKILFLLLLITGHWSLITVLTGCTVDKTARTEIKNLPWETYLFNKERHGQTEDTIISPPRLFNDFDIKSGIKFLYTYEPAQYSSPAIVNKVIYVGSSAKYLYAIDIVTGNPLWEFKTTGAVESSPTVASGMVYFGTNDGVLYCLNSSNGSEVWRFHIKTEIISSPIVEDGKIYFNSADDKLYALNAKTGEMLWQYKRGYVKKIVRRMFVSPAIFGDMIYCNFTDGYIAAIEKSSGNEVWAKRVAKPSDRWIGENITADIPRLTPTVSSGLIYLVNGDGFFTILDAKTGEEKWKFDIIRIFDFTIGYGGNIFLAGYDGSIIAMDGVSREVVWRRRVTQGFPASVIATGNHLIITSNYKSETLFFDSAVSYVDIFTADSGKKMWSEKIDSTISTTPTVAYNNLFLVTDKGHLRIYKSQTQD